MTDNDRELIELAAKAAGIPLSNDGDRIDTATNEYWNPLQSDGDALRMVLELCELTLINAGPCGMVTAAMKQRAEQICEKLEAGNGE